MMKKIFLLLPSALLLLGACSDDSLRTDKDCSSEFAGEVKIQAEIDQINLTRANDAGFADGDVFGLYAVDFANGQPGQLMSSGNNADNVDFKFDELNYEWNGSEAVRFKDDKTPVDVYGYYPYSEEIADVNKYPVSVEYNQDGDTSGKSMSAYEASDFLWAKAGGVSPSNPNVSLVFKHVLAAIRVSLVEGDGFESGEWGAIEKSVLIANTSRTAFADLSIGTVECTGEKDGRSIRCRLDKGDFRAVVVPQSVASGETLLQITVDNHSYNFTKNVRMDYLHGKQHNFTVKVTKAETGGDYEFEMVDESITPWESDSSSHNGEAKEYVVVSLKKAGTLEAEIKKCGFDPKEVTNLKLTGFLNESDFEFLRDNFRNLSAINLHEADLSAISASDMSSAGSGNWNYAIPRAAFEGLTKLRSCVFPKTLKAIGPEAFMTTSLRGSLEIPEGVVAVCSGAFGADGLHNNCLTGTLTLPSTLKYIGDFAFSNCDFTGGLHLPEGLQTVGRAAFENCSNFSGELHLPSSLQSVGFEAFSGLSNISGWLEMPATLSSVDGFSKMKLTGVVWPTVPFHLTGFSKTEIKSDLRLPDNLKSLGSQAFWQAKIKHITLPSSITKIPTECFNESTLQDTIVIPENVVSIDDWAFNYCQYLTAAVLPKSLNSIGIRAFGYCYGLNYIRCDAVEPPRIADDSAFVGVNKDNFTLEVPEGSVDAYRNAPVWKEFRRISAYRNFVARPSKYNVLNKGGKKEIVLNADAAWKMTECPSWCHIDKQSGSKKATLSLRVDPLPRGSGSRGGKISFTLTGDQEYTTTIDVAQYDYEYDEDQALTLQKATKGNGIDIVFIGDGYDAADISSGMYLADMKQEMEYFFGLEPYTTYRDYFNVHTAFALSEDSGVESINSWRNTKFDFILGDGCSKDGQRLKADYKAALDYCASTIPSTTNRSEPYVGCILVGNTDIYEGVCYSMSNAFCAVVTKSAENYPNDARGIVQHEAGGHGFGLFVDEYIYHNAFIDKCKCICCSHLPELLASQAAGKGLNLSVSGKLKSVPWSHLATHPSYGDIVDVYEGGYFHSRGVYRSEINSCMNNNVPYYSTWCRQLIVERIMKLAGEKFDLESFYAKDSRAAGTDFSGTTRGGAIRQSQSARHGNPPVLITNYKYGKKGGRK